MKLESVILRGTRASQPAAATSNTGRLYYVTDENVLERSNGSVWQSYSSIGGIVNCPLGYAYVQANETRYQDTGGDGGTTNDVAGYTGDIMTGSHILRNLVIYFHDNTLDAGTIVFTIMKNFVATGITCTATFGVTTTISDLTHLVSVAAGDLITLRCVAGGTTGQANFGFSYEIN